MVKHSPLLSVGAKKQRLLICHVELNEASVQLTNTLLIKSCKMQRSSALPGERALEERGEGVNKKDGVVRTRESVKDRSMSLHACEGKQMEH